MGVQVPQTGLGHHMPQPPERDLIKWGTGTLGLVGIVKMGVHVNGT